MHHNNLLKAILENPTANLIFGLLLGVILSFLFSIISSYIMQKYNTKMWLKEKRLFFYSKSIDDLKQIIKINNYMKTGFYDGTSGQEALKEDLNNQKLLMDEYFTSFSLIAEDNVLEEYKKLRSSIDSNTYSDISKYERIIKKAINKG